MKYLKPLTLIITLFFFLSCNNDNDNNSNEPSSIEIGNYIFNLKLNLRSKSYKELTLMLEI